MPLGSSLKERLKEISTGEMPPLTRAQRKRGFQYGPWQRFHADEDGKISFVSIFTVLAIVLFIGLVMNTTVSVKEKIEMQNAADAAAYSSVLWMARSMNAVTTINHLMGEQTALLTIVDGFGGPMLGNEEVDVDESTRLNDRLESARGSEANPMPAATKTSTLGAYLNFLDKPIVNNVYDFMVDDNGTHKGGAAVYDAKIRLKQLCEQIFQAKTAVNSGMEVAGLIEKTPFAWIGYIVDGVCVALHVELSRQLVELAKERKLLDLVESIVGEANKGRIVAKAIESLCLVLTLYTDTIVGGSKASKSDRLNRCIARTMDVIKSSHRVSAVKLFPEIGEIDLPIRSETPAIGREIKGEKPAEIGGWEIPGFGWSGDFANQSVLEEMFGGALGATKPLQPVVRFLKDKLSWLESLPSIPSKYAEFINQGGDWISQIEALVNIMDLIKPLDRNGSSENPCLGDNVSVKYRLPKFYWKAERESQWVRATYPYVDDYRSGLLNLMKKHLPRSNIATYYVNWTNRYTLANSFLMRKVDQDRESEKNANAIERLRSKIRDLRKKFDDALDSSEEEAAGAIGVAPFEAISDELLGIVKSVSVPEMLEPWKQRVLDHQNRAKQVGDTLSAGAGDDITNENLKALGTQIARINLLDELLTLVEDLANSLEVKPPHMYVMVYMDGKNKGIEPWTSDSKLVSEHFCIQASVKRNGQMIFMSPVFFSQHLAGDRTTVSQAMLYNANGRLIKAEPEARFQANTGWDTLNWEPPVKAFEWGKHEPSVESVSATAVFTTGRKVKTHAKTKINWQPKLTPLQVLNKRKTGVRH